MPHIVVKMFSGRTAAQKAELAQALTEAMTRLGTPESAISIGIEDVDKRDWMDKVAKPEIAGKPETIFKPPGYEIK